MSPPLVIVFGLAGDASRNLRTEPVQVTEEGRKIYLGDLWPTNEEIAQHLAIGANPGDYKTDTALRRPPFASVEEGSMLGHDQAYPLMVVVGDDITTDHISPASAIPPDSLVADFLVARSDDRNNLTASATAWCKPWQKTLMRKLLINRAHVTMPPLCQKGDKN